MKSRRFACFLFLIALTTGFVHGQDVELSTSVNSNRIGIEDRLQLTVTCKGVGNPPEPDLSSIKDFEPIPGVVQRGTEFIMSNSGSTLLTRFVYQLRPRRKGKLTVPSLSVQIDGRRYQSKAITVDVVAGKVARPAGPVVRRLPGFSNDPMEAFFNSQTSWEPELSIRTSLTKKTAYLGEAFLVCVELLTKDHVDEQRMLRAASIPGFWVEWADRENLAPPREEEVNGRQLTVLEIDRGLFIPQQTGQLEIPALEYAVLASPASGRASFFSSRVQLSRKTAAVPLEILPLPPEAEGLPIGAFTFKTSVNTESPDISDLLELRMLIRGSGNIRAVQLPELPTIQGLKPFPAKIDRKHYNENGDLNVLLSAEIPVSLSRAGRIEIPALTFRFFNPQTRRVEESSSDAMEIRVSGQPQQGKTSLSEGTDSVKRTGIDIDYLAEGSIEDPRQSWIWRPVFTLLLVVPFLLPLLPLLYRLILLPLHWLNSKGNGLSRLNAVQKRLRETQKSDEALLWLDRFLTDALSLRPAELNRKTLEQELIHKGMSLQMTTRLLDHRDKLLASRFAAAELSDMEFKDIREDFDRILNTMIREMK